MVLFCSIYYTRSLFLLLPDYRTIKDTLTFSMLPPIQLQTVTSPEEVKDDGHLPPLEWSDEALEIYSSTGENGGKYGPCGVCGYHPKDFTYYFRNWEWVRRKPGAQRNRADKPQTPSDMQVQDFDSSTAELSSASSACTSDAEAEMDEVCGTSSEFDPTGLPILTEEFCWPWCFRLFQGTSCLY